MLLSCASWIKLLSVLLSVVSCACAVSFNHCSLVNLKSMKV